MLHSLYILVTGVEEKEKRQLHALAQSQGAVVLSTAKADNPPHVIITRTVGSPRYFAILRRNENTPVVTPEWLTSCIAQGTRLPYSDFAAGIFQGLVICFSGLPLPEKRELGKQVERQGAGHSPTLDRRCSHLVTDSTQSEKYLFAQVNRIICVTPAWVVDSLEAGRCMDPLDYLLTTQKPSQQQHHSHLTKQTSLSRHLEREESDLLTRGGGGGAVSGMGDDHIQNKDEKSGHMHTTGGNEDQRSKLSDPSTSMGAFQRAGSIDAPTQRQPAHAQAQANPLATTPAVAVPWATLECDDDPPIYLDSCFISLVGCTDSEEHETLVLCAKSGAKRCLQIHPVLTTHIIVGSCLDDPKLDEAREFTSANREVAVVGLEWLRRSVARREPLPADERFIVELGADACAGRKVDKIGKTAIESGEGINLSIGGSGGAQDLARHPSGASMMSGFLDKHYFTLNAVRGTPEGDAAEVLIRSNGGRIFSSSIPSNSKECFAICPYSLPPHKLHSLRSSSPDFASVPESNRFTLYWLECCVQAGEILPLLAGTTCFQPLPYPLPIPGMDKVS